MGFVLQRLQGKPATRFETSVFNLERLAVAVVAEDVVIRNRIWPLLRCRQSLGVSNLKS